MVKKLQKKAAYLFLNTRQKLNVQNTLKFHILDLDGKSHVMEADGMLAICIQHEIDHLDGKLFIDRLSPLKKELAQKKLIKERLEREYDNKFT